MRDRSRSVRSEQALLAAELRARGRSWVDVAQYFRARYRLNARVAFRLVHGWSQGQVADEWNRRWPDDLKTFKNVSYWEQWPRPTGYAPSLHVLDKLAQLYECSVADLVGDLGDYGSGPRRPSPAAVAVPEPGRVPAQAGAGPAAPAAARHLPGGDVVAILLERLDHLAGSSGPWPAGPRERDRAFDQLVRFLTDWAHTVERRDMLRILAWAATAAATPIADALEPGEQERVASAIRTPSRVDSTVVEHVERVLWRCMRVDDALGPQAALDTVLAQRNVVRAMLGDCPRRLRARLLSLFGNLSGFAGWLFFDLGDFDSAWHLYEQARSLAHEARNAELGVMVLCNMSHLATWQNKPRVGIDHAVAAQSWAPHTDDLLLRAYASDVAARAHALEGQRKACLVELERAGTTVVAAGPSPSSSLAYFYGSGQLASTQATCHLQLHDARRAVEAAETSLHLLDPAFVRNVGFTKLKLANAHARTGDIDHAAAVFADAGALVAHNHSARLVQQLHDGRAQLEPWADTRAVRDLDDELAAYGLGRSGST